MGPRLSRNVWRANTGSGRPVNSLGTASLGSVQLGSLALVRRETRRGEARQGEAGRQGKSKRRDRGVPEPTRGSMGRLS